METPRQRAEKVVFDMGYTNIPVGDKHTTTSRSSPSLEKEKWIEAITQAIEDAEQQLQQ